MKSAARDRLSVFFVRNDTYLCRPASVTFITGSEYMDTIFMLMCFVSAERWHSHHLKIKRRTVSRAEHGFDKMLKNG